MAIRHTIAAALSTVALLSGPSLAADFASQLNEANIKATEATRETREIAAIHLSAAEGYSKAGNQVKAQQYLNFARSKLGLPVNQAQVAQPAIAPSGAAAQVVQDSGIVGLYPEAH
ncbi:hypothetical protein [Azospirillum sp. SYSU D00513]|uniref:hypothetical protein n=1 Tax=Azospirillum sp. SYSU D00513 TaxID=2812561 RepID=UPI001A957078|nr:hypothetical protein [Azospirillum sp. SYSU D00513]